MKTPPILIEIQDYLQKNPVSLDTTASDGRNGSVKDEATIIAVLQKKFGDKVIRKVANRLAGDMLVVDGNDTFVVNIKTTFGNSPDNAMSKGGYLLAFTNIEYSKIPDAMTFEKLGKLLQANKAPTDRDYWFLVISKHSGKGQKVLVRGLKQVTHGYANPTNLLQINWGKEFVTPETNFTFEQSWKNVVENIIHLSLKKRMEKIRKEFKIFGLTS